MTKNEFISELDRRLSSLPLGEIEKTLAWYTEVIEDRIEDGMTEEEAVNSLGSVEEIADKVLHDTPLPVLVKERMRRGGERARKDGTARRVLIAILLVLGFPVWFPILMSIVFVILGAYIAIWSVIVCMFAVVAALGAGAVGGIVAGVANIPVMGLLGVALAGCGLGCVGLCIAAFFAAKLAAKGLILVTRAIARGVKSLFIGREAAA